MSDGPSERHAPGEGPAEIGRREFLTTLGLAAAGILAGCSPAAREQFLRKHFQELSPAELVERIARLRADYEQRFGQEVSIAATPARPGVLFGYALDLGRCIGCRRCAYACVKENNQSRDPEIQWIRVLQMDKEEGVNIRHADPYYTPELVPEEGHFYMPVQCQ